MARDLLTVGDHRGVGDLPVMAVSIDGLYALALAAIVPDRTTKVVLSSSHVMPCDDPEIVAGLSEAEQAGVHALLVD